MCGYCFLRDHPEIKELRKAEKERKKEVAKAMRKKQNEKAKEWKAAHPRKATA